MKNTRFVGNLSTTFRQFLSQINVRDFLKNNRKTSEGFHHFPFVGQVDLWRIHNERTETKTCRSAKLFVDVGSMLFRLKYSFLSTVFPCKKKGACSVNFQAFSELTHT